MGCNNRARTNDTNFATQNASDLPQTRRKCKTKHNQDLEEIDFKLMKEVRLQVNHELDSTSDGYYQDSSITFESDTESGSSQNSQEEEDWTTYINRGTKGAEEKMRTLRAGSSFKRN